MESQPIATSAQPLLTLMCNFCFLSVHWDQHRWAANMNTACINEDCLELGNVVMDVKAIKATNLNISVYFLIFWKWHLLAEGLRINKTDSREKEPSGWSELLPSWSIFQQNRGVHQQRYVYPDHSTSLLVVKQQFGRWERLELQE